MDIIINALMKYAFKHQIGFVLTQNLGDHTPSASKPKNRMIIVNMNWYNKKEIPFQMAHELGHVINQDEGILYYSSFANKSKYERTANMTGLDILVPIYLDITGYSLDNVSPFMEQFDIPSDLGDDVICRFKKYISE